jgi:hypothetical protein
MARSARRLYRYLGWLLASAGLVAAACFTVNCLVDPLWYLQGNVLTGINHAFNERLSKTNLFLAHRGDYDCLILGTSRASLIPARDISGHHCFNFAFSDDQVSEELLYAGYLRALGFRPALVIVDVKREDFLGPGHPPDVPDFIRDGSSPPSVFISYLSLDALNFSIRTLRGDAPHHRYYDANFEAQLEIRSKKHIYQPGFPIAPMEPPTDVHPERAEQYIQLRQMFPEARTVAYLPPESAWRIAAFNLSGGLDDYLAAVGRIAAAYDDFRDFAIPSSLTESTDGTYDGSHYSAAINAHIAALLTADDPAPGIDWHGKDPAAILELYHQRLDKFIASGKSKEPPNG